MNCPLCGKRPQSCRCGKEPPFQFDAATIRMKVARANRLIDEIERDEAREREIQRDHIAGQAATLCPPPAEGGGKPLRRPRAPQRDRKRGHG